MTPMYIKNSDIVIAGYSVTSKETLEVCLRRVDETKKIIEEESVIVGVGNMIDLERKVSREEAVTLFEEHGIPSDHYFETSAKTGEGVEEVFIGAVRLWYEANKHHTEGSDSSDSIFVHDNDEFYQDPKKQCIIS